MNQNEDARLTDKERYLAEQVLVQTMIDNGELEIDSLETMISKANAKMITKPENTKKRGSSVALAAACIFVGLLIGSSIMPNPLTYADRFLMNIINWAKQTFTFSHTNDNTPVEERQYVSFSFGTKDSFASQYPEFLYPLYLPTGYVIERIETTELKNSSVFASMYFWSQDESQYIVIFLHYLLDGADSYRSLTNYEDSRFEFQRFEFLWHGQPAYIVTTPDSTLFAGVNNEFITEITLPYEDSDEILRIANCLIPLGQVSDNE